MTDKNFQQWHFHRYVSNFQIFEEGGTLFRIIINKDNPVNYTTNYKVFDDEFFGYMKQLRNDIGVLNSHNITSFDPFLIKKTDYKCNRAFNYILLFYYLFWIFIIFIICLVLVLFFGFLFIFIYFLKIFVFIKDKNLVGKEYKELS
jgi:hypothetical protein